MNTHDARCIVCRFCRTELPSPNVAEGVSVCILANVALFGVDNLVMELCADHAPMFASILRGMAGELDALTAPVEMN